MIKIIEKTPEKVVFETDMDESLANLGEGVVYPETLILLLEKDQEIELVARAWPGKGREHAKHIPGLVYYRHGCKIEISPEGEKHAELAELYPKVFEFDGKLKVKNEAYYGLGQEEIEEFKGVKVSPKKELVFFIESWGQMDAEDIFLESIEQIVNCLEELDKIIK